MNVKFDRPPVRTEITLKIAKWNQIMEDCGKWCVADIPFDKEKVHQSFIYHDGIFEEGGQTNIQFNIDPTDKWFAFADEIWWYANKKREKKKTTHKLLNDSWGSAFSSYID